MLSFRDFWRRHKRKILMAAGVLGSGYCLYKFYNAYRCSVDVLERQFTSERTNEELLKTQVQAHFENIQRIAVTTTLPHAMNLLSGRIAEELDQSNLIERLMKEKGQLSNSEKLELWDGLKILSFTRIVVSIWAVTMLSLYIRVQVTIVGRHLYIDTARGLGSSESLDEVDLVDWDDQQKFLASADFLANDGLLGLISGIEVVVTNVIKGRQLRDSFNTTALHDTIMQILNMFMGMGRPHQLVDYLMPEDDKFDMLAADSGSDDAARADATKFDGLMAEARAVLTSAEFGAVVEASFNVLVEALVADMAAQSTNRNLMSGIPLAKLLPLVAQVGVSLLVEPKENQYIELIRGMPEVELFFTLLYTNMPAL